MTVSMALSHADAAEPAAIVKSTTDQVLQALDENNRDDKTIHSVIEQMILPHFDFRKMSQWVLGKNWRQGTPEEQDRFVSEFQKLLVRTYSSALKQYHGEPVRVVSSYSDSDGRITTVKTEVKQAGGPVIPIDYKLYARDSDWKVFDVAVDGVSLVASYRTHFNEKIGANGLPALIDELAAKNAGQ